MVWQKSGDQPRHTHLQNIMGNSKSLVTPPKFKILVGHVEFRRRVQHEDNHKLHNHKTFGELQKSCLLNKLKVESNCTLNPHILISSNMRTAQATIQCMHVAYT